MGPACKDYHQIHAVCGEIIVSVNGIVNIKI